jgi:hypothetical protein
MGNAEGASTARAGPDRRISARVQQLQDADGGSSVRGAKQGGDFRIVGAINVGALVDQQRQDLDLRLEGGYVQRGLAWGDNSRSALLGGPIR